MGPRSIERGMARVRPQLHRHRAASTGPRSIERGMWEYPLASVGVLVASTGPRSIERGMPSEWHYATMARATLQRGRAQLSAEWARLCGVPRCQSMSLQRGRAQLSAEWYLPERRLRSVGLASTGPRSIERGMFNPPLRNCAGNVASTGPRSIERGMSALIVSAKDGPDKSKMRAPSPQASSQGTTAAKGREQGPAGQRVVPRERRAVFPRPPAARVS
jgi:hypothetical protein